MRVSLGDFSFTLPDSWRDASSYTYKSKTRPVALTVSVGRTRKFVSFAELADQRRHEVSETMGDDIEFLEEGVGNVATWPAVLQSFTFGGRDNRYWEFRATAYCGANNSLSLSYVGPQKDKTLQAIFSRITASCQPSSRPRSQHVAERYVWRQAHTVCLQMPEELEAPRHYSYVSPYGIILKARFCAPGASRPNTSIEDDTAHDLRFEGDRGTSSRERHNNFAIEQVDYVFQSGDPIEPTRCRAHRAQIDGFGARLSLYLRGDESQASRIDALWRHLMSDLVKNTSAPRKE